MTVRPREAATGAIRSMARRARGMLGTVRPALRKKVLIASSRTGTAERISPRAGVTQNLSTRMPASARPATFASSITNRPRGVRASVRAIIESRVWMTAASASVT
jgi:hypothetical protein